MSLVSPAADARAAIAQLGAWLDESEPAGSLLITTSGSTGTPKQVVLSRSAVLASVEASAQRLGSQGRWLLALPSSYVAGVQVVVRSLVAGHGPVVVADLDFAAAVSRVPAAATSPLFTSLVPTQLHRLLSDERQLAALREMHTILLGGGPIDPGLRARAEQQGLRIVATYGASETAGGCVYDGLPLDGVRVDVGAGGRIRIGGPTLFSEYADDPVLTAQALVAGCYLTSDVGRIDPQGRLHVLGRIDDVAVSGGVNVPLPAVAARLREHTAVREVEVLGVQDVEWGIRVVAFVVGEVALDEVRDWISSEHPRAWAPHQVVALDALPLLANGKVDRETLRGLV